jgi:hypothetical protein
MQDERRDLCLSVAPGMPTAARRRGVRDGTRGQGEDHRSVMDSYG